MISLLVDQLVHALSAVIINWLTRVEIFCTTSIVYGMGHGFTNGALSTDQFVSLCKLVLC